MEAFVPVVFLFVLGIVVSATIFAISNLLNPKLRPAPAVKYQPYECGVRPEGSARAPFRTRFYMIAVLFLLFDVEGVFFLPWARVYRESLAEGGALLVAILVYMFLMVLGLVYIFRKRVLEIE